MFPIVRGCYLLNGIIHAMGVEKSPLETGNGLSEMTEIVQRTKDNLWESIGYELLLSATGLLSIMKRAKLIPPAPGHAKYGAPSMVYDPEGFDLWESNNPEKGLELRIKYERREQILTTLYLGARFSTQSGLVLSGIQQELSLPGKSAELLEAYFQEGYANAQSSYRVRAKNHEDPLLRQMRHTGMLFDKENPYNPKKEKTQYDQWKIENSQFLNLPEQYAYYHMGVLTMCLLKSTSV